MQGHSAANPIFDVTVIDGECNLHEKPPEHVQNQSDSCLLY